MTRTGTPMRDLGLTTTKAVIRDVLTQAWATQAGHQLAGMRVLDVGTGNGALLRWLLREGVDGFGIEPNAGLLRAAVADRERPAPPGRWLAGKAERLPLRRASVDIVLFFNSLHHVPVTRQVAALAEAARCLRPAGALVVIEPVAAGSYFELWPPSTTKRGCGRRPRPHSRPSAAASSRSSRKPASRRASPLRTSGRWSPASPAPIRHARPPPAPPCR
jgi:SAM-dependent methyltransferase